MVEAKVEKAPGKTEAPKKVCIDYFSCYKGKPMVHVSGPFFGGGFHISKSKAKAIIECADQLKEFFDGKFDEQIKNLKQDEILKLNG